MTDEDAIYMILSTEEHNDKGHPLWWSNAFGWTAQDQADRFTEDETRVLNLPVTGRWAEVAVDEFVPPVRQTDWEVYVESLDVDTDSEPCPKCKGEIICDEEGDWNHVIRDDDGKCIALTLDHQGE